MKHVFAALLCSALLFAGYRGASAQSTAPVTAASCPAGTHFVKPYTKSNGTQVAGHCSKSSSKKSASTDAAPAASAAPAMAASPSTMKSTSGAASTAKTTSETAPAPGSTTCPQGKSYVNGYTKKSGTKVAGYCRKSPTKKS